MPEGDAVWRTARRLAEAFDGRVLTRGELRVPRYATHDLAGRRVVGTVSRGKHILTRLDDGVTLHTHLRMEGSWRIVPHGRRPPPGDVVRAVLADDRSQAFGIRLGITELVPTRDEGLDHLGPDLLGADWDADAAVANLRADADRTIGEALLDQRNLAGIGTIYRAETLFLRGVSPLTPVRDVDDLHALVRLARRLLDANKERGAIVTTGDRRAPANSLWAYGRTRRPCRRCGTPIERGELGEQERLIFWCPRCQP